MTNAASEYEALGARLCVREGVVPAQMFGKACLKVAGKAFMAQHKEWVVFKLGGAHREKALTLKGAELWDPSGKGRPMKEWIALPVSESKHFQAFADAALSYVAAG